MEVTTPCITWAGTTQKNNGYGRISVNGKQPMAHRWAWEQVNGPIPEGLTIDHLCFNRACIEPLHMRVVTRAVNGARHQEGCQCLSHAGPSRPAPRECRRGHDLTLPGALTAVPAGRKRGVCRVCAQAAWRKYAARKKETA